MAMTADSVPRPGGSIYDLGYQRFEGQRLGRSHAISALFVYSLRAIFGFGRSAGSKVFPFGLTVITLLPAIVQLGIAALLPAQFKVFRPENYFGFTQIILALFCAVVAPEIIGRDQRNRVLPLYFSRALSRSDYVAAKAGALFAGLFLVCFVPQALLLIGNGVAASDLLAYMRDNWDQVPPVVAGCILVASFMGSVALCVASQTPRRALSTGAVLAFFVILDSLGRVLVETTSGDAQKYSVLLSPLDVLNGAVEWIFSAAPEADSAVAKSGLSGELLFLAAIVYTAAALTLLFRRFQRLSV
jgi:ABC-2 type transport system permease protein